MFFKVHVQQSTLGMDDIHHQLSFGRELYMSEAIKGLGFLVKFILRFGLHTEELTKWSAWALQGSSPKNLKLKKVTMIAGFFLNFMVYVYKNKLFTLQYSYSSNLIISCELERFQLDCLQIEQRPSAKYGMLESEKGLSPILKLQQLLASPKYCIVSILS